ncbi:ankyrin-1-like, partial [Daphnia pulicaria]|uniref:ankyrin-1-like n=1 Tax=Daphnia pulicaria TaxID=35523 RepID=UPI001EEA37D8
MPLTFWAELSGLFGWTYNQKLSYVPFAGTKPEEKHEISPSALFLFLHDDKTGEILQDTKHDIAEMLDVIKDIDKASKITLVEIHQSSLLGSATDFFKAFHVFNVFRTTSESDGGDYWWSLEKNTKHIILQRSRKKNDVKNKLEGDERKQVKLIKKGFKGKGTIKNLFAILLSVIRVHYNLGLSNCQSLVSFISKEITEIGYDFKGVGLYSFFPDELRHLRNQNAKLNRALWQIIHLANDIPVTNESYPSIIDVHWTDLTDLMLKSGNYDINALYGGFTSLHFALLLDKYEMVRNLLKPPLNADPTTRDSRFGVNALHLVAIDYFIPSDIIDLLLAHPKVNIDDVNQRGRTALHFAARVSNVMVVRKLLGNGANPNIGDNEGLTPLHLAARRDTKTVNIDAIIKAQKAKQRHVDEDKSHNGWTALHHAADSSNEIIAEHLIDVGADVNSRDNDGLTPFHVAALKAKNMQIIDSILWKMKDMNQYRKDEKLFCCAYRNENLLGAEIVARLKRIDSLKENPQSRIDKKFLHHSDRSASAVVMNGFPQLGRLRIESAKNAQEIDTILKDFYIDQSDENGESPLFFAIRANNVIAVGLLLERGADSNRRNNNGLTPFQVAATQEKDFKILDLLLTNDKVDIDGGGQSGYSVLHWAMATSNVTAARFLLSKGANPNVADRNGATPLHVAAYCADTTDVLDLILEKEKVDINRRDKNGQTALHYAVRGYRVYNVDYLLENGANPAIRDENGDTPLHLAAAAFNKNSAILDLLLATEKKIQINERNNAGMTALHMA